MSGAAEPDELGRWADDGGAARAKPQTVADGKRIAGPGYASWEQGAAEPEGDTRALYAVMLLAGSLGGGGLSALGVTLRPKEPGQVSCLIREAVGTAFVIVDEVMRQAEGAK